MAKKKLSMLIFAALAVAWIMMGVASAQEEAKPTDKKPMVLEKTPVRILQDPYPTFNGIAMDVEKGEVMMTDDNRASMLTYASQFEPTDRVMEPRREIRGPKAHLGWICQLAVSPEAKEMYTVDNDWMDNMCVHSLDAKGDAAPLRELNIDHGAWGIFLDKKNDELVITTEHVNKISVYRRLAEGDEEQLRIIQGPKTGLADPHGVFVDAENNEIFVTNHGHWRKTETGEGYALFFGKKAEEEDKSRPLAASTGKSLPSSITVYSRTAKGDAAPLRTIQGSKTRLNWPLGISMDTVSDQIAVANTDNSILFFDRKANGDVAPARVIKGPATGLSGPTGIVVDTKRNELWVTNWNNHTATVYPRTEDGNAAPLRTIRSAPKDAPVTGFGNPGDVAYDPKRKQILVPN